LQKHHLFQGLKYYNRVRKKSFTTFKFQFLLLGGKVIFSSGTPLAEWTFPISCPKIVLEKKGRVHQGLEYYHRVGKRSFTFFKFQFLLLGGT
jgi:hypothetical protein